MRHWFLKKPTNLTEGLWNDLGFLDISNFLNAMSLTLDNIFNIWRKTIFTISVQNIFVIIKILMRLNVRGTSLITGITQC